MKCYGWRQIKDFAGEEFNKKDCIYPIASDNPNYVYDDERIQKKALTYISSLNKMVGYEKFEVVGIST